MEDVGIVSAFFSRMKITSQKLNKMLIETDERMNNFPKNYLFLMLKINKIKEQKTSIEQTIIP